jgi:hypothetical protein
VNKACAHTLVEKLFKAPTYCQVCHGFILGIGKKSCVCSVCFFTCHKKCADDAPHTCVDKTEADLVPEPGVKENITQQQQQEEEEKMKGEDERKEK